MGKDRVRFSPDERLDIDDAMLMSGLPVAYAEMVAGAIFGTADGVLSTGGLSWTTSPVGSGGSVAQLRNTVMYGGNPKSPGALHNQDTYLPSGEILWFRATDGQQVYVHQGRFEFLAAQAAGTGASVWWRRVEADTDLENRRAFESVSNREKVVALLTKTRSFADFAVVPGDFPFSVEPDEADSPWHRLLFVSGFDEDGVPQESFWSSPLDYWLSPPNSYGGLLSSMLSDGGSVQTGLSEGLHATLATVVRRLASELIRTRDSRAVVASGSGGVSTISGDYDFHAVGRGTIQLDEAVSALESRLGTTQETSSVPPLLWAGSVGRLGEASVSGWESPAVAGIKVEARSGPVYEIVFPSAAPNWIAVTAQGSGGDSMGGVFADYLGNSRYALRRSEGGEAIHWAHTLFIYGR